MTSCLKYLCSILILGLVVISCAKRGSPTGGEKDMLPPDFLYANPEQFSTNFDAENIRIYFDEYIKLKDAQDQIIISPPIDPRPQISPLGNARKYIEVEFANDSVLRANTTYAINFGTSIEDHNEGNKLGYFSYVFSTGAYIDSLSVSGTIKNALSQKTDDFVTVALYEIDDTYSDSIVYKEIPRYVTNTLDSTTNFRLNNLREGRYKIVAFKDNNNNYKYEPRSDKLAFLPDTIVLPRDTAKSYELRLFKEDLPLKFERPKQVSKQHLIFGYEGIATQPELNLLTNTPNEFDYRILKDRSTDSLHFWYKPFIETLDSLVFTVRDGAYEDTLISRIKNQYSDSLVLTVGSKNPLVFNKPLSLFANTPLERIDASLFNLIDQDSLEVPFTLQINDTINTIEVSFEKAESNAYTLNLLPSAVTDFFGNTNDSLTFSLRTKELSDYGDLIFTIENAKSYPILVQLVDERGQVIESAYRTTEGPFEFSFLEPKQYNIRIIYDENKNGRWDTGSYLNNKQPEPVIFYPSKVDVRANSEIYQSFTLN